MRIIVKLDSRKVDAWAKSLPFVLKVNTRKVVDMGLKKMMLSAKFLAPNRTGKLKSGIFIGYRRSGKFVESGTVNWRELDSRRGRSFRRNQWNNFAYWMHNSPFARRYAGMNPKTGKVYTWKTGIPNFFDKAMELNAKNVVKGIEQGVDRALKG